MSGAVQPSWRVVVRGPVEEEAMTRLPEDRAIYVSGHMGGGAQSRSFYVVAFNAESATALVQEILDVSPTLIFAERLPFTVAIGVPVRDADAIDGVLGDPWARPSAALLELETPEGIEEFLLSIVAESEEEAVRSAEAQYRELRERAGLALDSAEILYVAPPWHGDALPHRRILDDARAAVDHPNSALALVLAQAAFERLVRETIDEAFAVRDLAWLRGHLAFRSYSLADSRLRQFWDDLMGDAVGRCDGWARYQEHLRRRNLLVHEGRVPTHDDVAESVAAVEAMTVYVERLRTDR